MATAVAMAHGVGASQGPSARGLGPPRPNINRVYGTDIVCFRLYFNVCRRPTFFLKADQSRRKLCLTTALSAKYQFENKSARLECRCVFYR